MQLVSLTNLHTELFKSQAGETDGLCLHSDPNYQNSSLAACTVLVCWPHNVCHVGKTNAREACQDNITCSAPVLTEHTLINHLKIVFAHFQYSQNSVLWS